MEFKELNLHPDLQRGIAEAGYVACMPVQEQVLANAFGGQDLYVQSQTGTGKTAAFLVVIYQRLLAEPPLKGKKAIIMVPTRELAVQVEEEAKILGKYLPFKVGSFYGGVGYAQQQALLKDNAQILVGTPGRVLDLNKSGRMNLMEIAFLVLDEADRMFDMGFYPDLRKLIKVVPPADRRQTMLFSATLNAWVKNLAWEYTKSPLEIEIAPESVTVEEVDQVLYHVPSGDKMKFLLGLMEQEKPESAIIFCNTKRYTEIVAKRLRLNGIDCEFIIGDLPQVKRLKIIEDVKAGTVKYLVATDVAARGLDIEGLAMVVNYDLPVEAENYVHRIGRTARAGKTGKAVTLASEQDVYELPAIERYIGKKIPSETASADRYAEDKSQGMRVRSDFFGGREDRFSRGEGRGLGFGGRESRDRDGRGREGGRREGSRRNEAHEGRRETGRGREEGRSRREGPLNREAPLNREGRGPGRREEGPGREGGRRTPPAGARKAPAYKGDSASRPEGEKQNLSHLSFEERMAYYKQKYEAPPGNSAPESPPRAASAVPEGNAGGRGRTAPPRRDRKRKGGARQGGNPRKRDRSGPDRELPPQPAGEKGEKGILRKLFGIFRKRPDPGQG
ncbi:MAG: DEAD/DEAH box helicase [Spirochaetaceae bacterium]|jgi:ATP-dependent RNA helicase RhlB|nr:DEAD/DEAH box helicase [Spirochaetaceae bacterium]